MRNVIFVLFMLSSIITTSYADDTYEDAFEWHKERNQWDIWSQHTALNPEIQIYENEDGSYTGVFSTTLGNISGSYFTQFSYNEVNDTYVLNGGTHHAVEGGNAQQQANANELDEIIEDSITENHVCTTETDDCLTPYEVIDPNTDEDSPTIYQNHDGDFIDENGDLVEVAETSEVDDTAQTVTLQEETAEEAPETYTVETSDGETVTVLKSDVTDNGDGTYTYDGKTYKLVDDQIHEVYTVTTSDGETITVLKSDVTDNGDGTYTYNGKTYKLVDGVVTEVIEPKLEVQGPVQPANVKKKSKADKLVDGITDTWKSINSLDDICHAGNIYLQSPEVNGFSLQYKNEKCEEYFGVKFTLKF